MQRDCNGVFEGGGVRGIGHVGAATVLEAAGYRFRRLAGCSAGAIVAALLACGYTGAELTPILENLDYLRFRGGDGLSGLGPPGKAVSILLRLGIYSADYLEEWLSRLLAAKGCRVFGDIPAGSLQVTASDVTDRRLLVLPRDLWQFGLTPDSFSIAAAVRMSMSIPIYYRPYRLRGVGPCPHLVVDGGLLSNYPVWIFDNDNDPNPTIGFKFMDAPCQGHCLGGGCKAPSLPEYLRSLSATAMDAADKQHISEVKGDFARTVTIPITVMVEGEPVKIGATDFGITKEESRLLFQNGADAARLFLRQWCFEDWKRRYQGAGRAVNNSRDYILV